VGCCKGAVRDAIRGIPVSDQNYKLAWSVLEERFNKPRLVARSLIEKLFNAPRAPSENLVELNKLLVVFDEGVSLLESLHLPNLGDFILFSIASRRLPTYRIKLFEAQLANGFPTVQELLKFVKSRVAILECIPHQSLHQNNQTLTNLLRLHHIMRGAATAHLHGYKQQPVKGITVLHVLQGYSWFNVMSKVQGLDARNS